VTNQVEHCQRAWWKRPPVWFIVGAAVLALGISVVIEETGRRAPTSYGAFLDQLEAGNVASVTFQGTQINGRFNHPLEKAQTEAFSTQVPEFGDPTLIPELRKQRVVIDVQSSSSWTSLLARLPWPMVLFVGAALIAGLVRLVRGGKAQAGSATPMHGMMGLVSGLFGRPQQAESPPPHQGDDAEKR
jgi:ATP-dependent Zn protease